MLETVLVTLQEENLFLKQHWGRLVSYLKSEEVTLNGEEQYCTMQGQLFQMNWRQTRNLTHS
jgi:hypothetical protein